MSVNLLSEFILAAVLRSAALCIPLRNILRKWFVATVLTPPTHVLQPQKFIRIFGNDSEAILARISALFPGGQTFSSEKHLEEFANHID